MGPGPTLAEFFQQAGIERYPAFAPFVQLSKQPFKSQVQGLTLCVHHQWFGLLDETGAGKSIPVTAAALHYIGMGNRVLVVTQASLIYQFAESVVEDFIGIERYIKVHPLAEGPRERAKLFKAWDAGGWPEILVMSYELFAVHGLHAVAKAAGYDVLITDESQKWKSPKSSFAKRIAEYVGKPDRMETAFFPMTGTPMHTALLDCYPLVSLLAPGVYGSFDEFQAKHCVYKKIPLKQPRKTKWGMQTHFKMLVGYKNHAKLNEALFRRARRVMKRDIPELAALKDPIITEVPVRLSQQHMVLYRRLRDERMLDLGDDQIITAEKEQELRQRVLQLITSPELFVPPGTEIENAVLEACKTLIEPVCEESKVILFANYQDTVALYAKAFAHLNPVIMNGTVSPAQREAARLTFLNDPECRLLVANPKSAGAGFNFQSVCHTVVYAEPTGSPGDFKQSMDRVVRPGQLWACNIYVIKALSTVAPNAIKEMLRRDTDVTLVTRDRTSLRHFYNIA